MADVLINWNNRIIGVMEQSGAVVIKTAGTKMSHDISVQYTKPGSESIETELEEINDRLEAIL